MCNYTGAYFNMNILSISVLKHHLVYRGDIFARDALEIIFHQSGKLVRGHKRGKGSIDNFLRSITQQFWHGRADKSNQPILN